MQIERSRAVKILRDLGGEFFSVEFTKRTTGELRNMICRKGVKKYTKGGKLKYNASSYGLLPVFDMQNGYRMVNLDGLKSMKVGGEVYEITE